MAEITKRQLMWLFVGVTVLVVAMTGWSQLRLHAVRAELDALAAESEELGARNRALQQKKMRALEARDEIRMVGQESALQVVGSSPQVRGTMFLDRGTRRALFVIEPTLLTWTSGKRYQIWLRGPRGDWPAATFELDGSSQIELLLHEVPDNILGSELRSSP